MKIRIHTYIGKDVWTQVVEVMLPPSLDPLAVALLALTPWWPTTT